MIYFSKELPKMLIFLLLPSASQQSHICILLVFLTHLPSNYILAALQYFREAGTEEGQVFILGRVQSKGIFWPKLTQRIGNRIFSWNP